MANEPHHEPARPARGLAFEDLQVGAQYETATTQATERDIIAFATQWDPQPFHTDPEAGAASFLGSLCASGLHTIALAFRQYFDLGILDGTALAGLGLEQVRFMRPLKPGDTIRTRVRVKSLHETRAPDRGIVVLALATFNQDDVQILDMDLRIMVARRPVPPT